jgi:hypothetical protein
MDKLTNYPAILAGQRPQTLQELFSNKSRWCKNADAHDALGNSVEVTNVKAVAWCLGGAMRLLFCSGQSADSADAVKFHAVQGQIIDYLAAKISQDEDIEDLRSVAGFNDARATSFKDIRELVVKLNI